MKTFVVALVLLAATSTLGQDPYEYIDDALLQKVGQIVFEYDQKVAASRSGGSASSNNVATSRSFNDNTAGYQVGRQERVARVTNFDKPNTNNVVNYAPAPQYQQQVRSQRQYNHVQQQSYAQAQPQQYNNYQANYNQRQVAAPVPVARTYQSSRPVNQGYQQAVPVQQRGYAYEAPRPVSRTYQQAPVARTYQEPQVFQQPQKNAGFSGYTLSQPEVAERVAEFHFTDSLQSQDSLGSRSSVGITDGQQNGGFRLA